MSVYRSRHQPRRHTTLAGRIEDVERYDRYYDIAYDAIRERTLPTVSLPVGRFLVRTNSYKYDAREIPANSSTKITNRFSGLRLDGRAGQGALYVGSSAGVLREHAHYSLPKLKKQPDRIWTPAAKDVTSEFMHGQRTGELPPDEESRVYLFRVNQTLRLADLRTTSLAPFMARLRRAGLQRYGIADGAIVDFLAMAASHPNDYSASRGMADAVFDLSHSSGLAGVCAFSARADKDSGLVLSSAGDPIDDWIFAIFGTASTVVTTLTPVPSSSGKLAFDTYAEVLSAIPSK